MPGSGDLLVKGFVFLVRIAVALFGAATLASAQPVAAPTAPGQTPQATQLSQPQQRITPNFKDADITQIAEAVAAATGKNFIMDPRVRAQVTMLSSTPIFLPSASMPAMSRRPLPSGTKSVTGAWPV